jgi:FKBP-type peptidyl-prolyl cis-trans isomerase (trigger factor)
MQVNCTKISDTEREFEVAIPSADFETFIEEASRRMSEGLEVAGFRKGHVPRDIVEQKVGSAKLLSEAAERAVRGTLKKALDTQKDATYPEQVVSDVQILKLAPKNPFVYKVALFTPALDLAKDYRDIAHRVWAREKREVKVEEKEVETTLEWLSKHHTQKGSTTGVIDDEFARKVGDFENLESLKAGIKEGIVMEKETKEKDRVRLLIAKEILQHSKSEIPPKVISAQILRMEEEFKQRIGEMGLDFDTYLKNIQKKREDLQEGWRDEAKERVKISLVLNEVGKREHIEVSDEEVVQEAQKISNRYKNTKDAKIDIDSARLAEYVRGIIQNEKVFTFLENL